MTTHVSLDAAREAYDYAVRRRKSLEHGGVCSFEDIQDWRKACDEQSQYADMLIPLLEGALAAQVERTRLLSNDRELLLRYGRAMLADMTKEGLNTIAMMQMKAVLDKEDADHD